MIKLKPLVEAQDEEESITLYYREGPSDKVYTAILRQEQGGWLVDAQWGRRGSTMQTGTKTNSPVPYESAKKIYDKLVSSKMAKGYKPGPDATIYTSPSPASKKADTGKKDIDVDVQVDSRKTGTYPQLLNPIGTEHLAIYMNDNAYGAQEKYDGKRIIIDISDSGVTGINKKGLRTEIPREISLDVSDLTGKTLDGELVGDVYYVFDLLKTDGKEIYNWPYKKRYNELEKISFEPHVILAHLAIGQSAKKRLYDILKQNKKEGLVFKDLNAPYKAGRPTKGGTQLKHKFWESVSAVVSRINQKRSIAVQLLEGNKWIDMGNVTIPPNKEIPSVGDVVEIKYLYVLQKGGSLYQPQYIGPRDDVDKEECTTKQLKYKK